MAAPQPGGTTLPPAQPAPLPGAPAAGVGRPQQVPPTAPSWSASPQAAPAQPAPVVLTLTSHKVLYLNDERVDDLAPALARFERAQPVTVRADGALALTDFVDLVDRVKALGFEKVALEVRRT